MNTEKKRVDNYGRANPRNRSYQPEPKSAHREIRARPGPSGSAKPDEVPARRGRGGKRTLPLAPLHHSPRRARPDRAFHERESRRWCPCAPPCSSRVVARPLSRSGAAPSRRPPERRVASADGRGGRRSLARPLAASSVAQRGRARPQRRARPQPRPPRKRPIRDHVLSSPVSYRKTRLQARRPYSVRSSLTAAPRADEDLERPRQKRPGKRRLPRARGGIAAMIAPTAQIPTSASRPPPPCPSHPLEEEAEAGSATTRRSGNAIVRRPCPARARCGRLARGRARPARVASLG